MSFTAKPVSKSKRFKRVVGGLLFLGVLIFLVTSYEETQTQARRDEAQSVLTQTALSIESVGGSNTNSASSSGAITQATVDELPAVQELESQTVELAAAVPSEPITAASTDSARGHSVSNEPGLPTLSPQVYAVIEEVQLLQQAGQWEEALNEMNALYQDFDQLTPFEQTTLLNFYTNTLYRLEMWQESISAFSLMLTIPDLRPDLNARALLALGQLHTTVGDNEAAIGYLEEWLRFTAGTQNREAQTQQVQELLASVKRGANTPL